MNGISDSEKQCLEHFAPHMYPARLTTRLTTPTSGQQKRVLNLFRYEVNLPLPQHVWSVLVVDERNQDGFLLVPKRMTSPLSRIPGQKRHAENHPLE
jgi:hypothetical protein